MLEDQGRGEVGCEMFSCIFKKDKGGSQVKTRLSNLISLYNSCSTSLHKLQTLQLSFSLGCVGAKQVELTSFDLFISQVKIIK